MFQEECLAELEGELFDLRDQLAAAEGACEIICRSLMWHAAQQRRQIALKNCSGLLWLFEC